jgi:hypothetical protein
MYTAPRPIIPRYRAISGLLSVLIVVALLCTGAGYYVKATGKLNYLMHMTGNALPSNIKSVPTQPLPDPPNKIDQGPAYNIIPSAVTTSHLDPNNQYFATQPDKVFQAGKAFYVIYSVLHPKTQGHVVIDWYTNDQFYGSATSKLVPTGETITGSAPMQYLHPAEGKVMLYWQDQTGNKILAQALYFVVR